VTTAAAGVPEPGLFPGVVMHHRLRPFRHRFVYRVFSVLLDLDRLDALDRRLRLFSVERGNLFSFRNKDHGPRDGGALRPWVEACLAELGLDLDGGPIRLLCFPRVLGYVFNPLSVYFCYDPANTLRAIVYEVKNTFGGQRAYTLPVDERRSDGQIRQACGKDFYVSPFIDLEAGYRFKVIPPADRLSVVIHEEIEAGTQLVATLTGRRVPLTDRQLLLAALRVPFMTQKVIAGIHWEALKLWLKGAGFRSRHDLPVQQGDHGA
jgi:DUF1365 family protein